MSDLTKFLLARIAEDEVVARGAQADAMVGARWKHWTADAYEEIQAATLSATRRTLAECEAKRRIVELAEEASSLDMQVDSEFRVGPRDEVSEPYVGDVILRALAQPYADHPDFNPAWRV